MTPLPTVPSNTCGTCRFWRFGYERPALPLYPEKGPQRYGECRIRAPIPSLQSQPNWAHVSDTDWCGEFARVRTPMPTVRFHGGWDTPADTKPAEPADLVPLTPAEKVQPTDKLIITVPKESVRETFLTPYADDGPPYIIPAEK